MTQATTWCEYPAEGFGAGAVALRDEKIACIALPGKWSANVGLWTEKTRVDSRFARGVARDLSLFFGGKATPRDLVGELDFDGVGSMTDFRRRVLAACAGIPRGDCVTYGELGAMVGMEPGKCGRAIGGVMAWNPFPLVVPCHRVLSSGHRVGHYGGGAAMKVALLRREGATGYRA